MSHQAERGNLDNVFSSFSENWKMVVEKLKEDSPRENSENFSLDEYWTKLDTVCKSVSFDATKITLCFSKPPPPSAVECESLLGATQIKVLALVSLHYKLPSEYGRTLRKVTGQLLIKIVLGLVELIQKIKQERYLSSQEQLQNTGEVWAACDAFSTTPRDNKQAVLGELRVEAGLVKDVLEELQEAASQDVFEEDFDPFETDEDNPSRETRSWSAKEKALLSPLSGLVKASRSCFKKIIGVVKQNGSCDIEGSMKQLDDLMTTGKEVVPLLDELVSNVYPPLDGPSLRENASKVSDTLHKFLDLTQHSHLCGEADLQWIEFLHKAISHNMDQIKNMMKEEGQG